jgi:hypothetical protein
MFNGWTETFDLFSLVELEDDGWETRTWLVSRGRTMFGGWDGDNSDITEGFKTAMVETKTSLIIVGGTCPPSSRFWEVVDEEELDEDEEAEVVWVVVSEACAEEALCTTCPPFLEDEEVTLAPWKGVLTCLDRQVAV